MILALSNSQSAIKLSQLERPFPLPGNRVDTYPMCPCKYTGKLKKQNLGQITSLWMYQTGPRSPASLYRHYCVAVCVWLNVVLNNLLTCSTRENHSNRKLIDPNDSLLTKYLWKNKVYKLLWRTKQSKKSNQVTSVSINRTRLKQRKWGDQEFKVQDFNYVLMQRNLRTKCNKRIRIKGQQLNE